MIGALSLQSVALASDALGEENGRRKHTRMTAASMGCEGGSFVAVGVAFVYLLSLMHSALHPNRICREGQLWHVSHVPMRGFSWADGGASLTNTTHCLGASEVAHDVRKLFGPLIAWDLRRHDRSTLYDGTMCLHSDVVDLCIGDLGHPSRSISVIEHTPDWPRPNLVPPPLVDWREWALVQTILFKYADLCRGLHTAENETEAGQPKLCLMTGVPVEDLGALVPHSLHLRSLACQRWSIIFGDAIVFERRMENGTVEAQIIQDLESQGLQLYERQKRSSMLHKTMPCE